MSRKGKMPISLPKGVEVKATDTEVEVKGPKGVLNQILRKEVAVDVNEDVVQVRLREQYASAKNMHGLFRSLIANMVTGVSEGFIKELEMIGVGYRASVSGQTLDLQIGVSHPTKLQIPEGLKVEVKDNTKLKVSGIDKREVGEFAAKIRAKRKPEPYKGKGIRYKDEYVRRKAGKTGK